MNNGSLSKISDYFTTSAGVAFAQAISFVSIPLVAKLVGPEAFGEYGFIFSMATLGIVAVTLKAELGALILPESKLKYLAPAFYRIVAFMSFFLAICSIPFLPSFQGAFDFIAVLVLLMGLSLFEFRVQINIRKGNFKSNAVIRVCRALLFPLFFLALFAFHKSSYVVVLCMGLANFLSSQIGENIFKEIFSIKISLKKWLVIVRSLRDTIIYMTPAHLLNRYSGNVFVLMLGAFVKDPVGIAMYLLAHKFVIAPISIITSAAADVVKKDMLANPSLAMRRYIKISYLSLLAGCVGVLVIYYLSGPLIGLFMGDEWLIAEKYAIALSPLFFTLLVLSPLTHVYIVFKKQKLDMMWQIFNAAFVTVAIYAGISFSTLDAVWVYSWASALSIAVSFFVCLLIVKRRVGK